MIEPLRNGVLRLTAVADVVVLDCGGGFGGLPVFDVLEVAGEPQLEAVNSEALPWLLPDGDGPAPGTPDTSVPASFAAVRLNGLVVTTSPPSRFGRHDYVYVNELPAGHVRLHAIDPMAPGEASPSPPEVESQIEEEMS